MNCTASDNHKAGGGGKCGGEMIEVGKTYIGLTPFSPSGKTLYQCESCKTIKLV